MKINFRMKDYMIKINFTTKTAKQMCIALKTNPIAIRQVVQNAICIIPCRDTTICGEFVCGEEVKISREKVV